MLPAENIEHSPRSRQRLDADFVFAHSRFSGSFGAKGARLILAFGQALLEAVDALAEVAHQVGDLAAPAEQDQGDRAQDQKVPDAQCAHENSPWQMIVCCYGTGRPVATFQPRSAARCGQDAAIYRGTIFFCRTRWQTKC